MHDTTLSIIAHPLHLVGELFSRLFDQILHQQSFDGESLPVQEGRIIGRVVVHVEQLINKEKTLVAGIEDRPNDFKYR